jgi:flagellar hook assembly protein FlgD
MSNTISQQLQQQQLLQQQQNAEQQQSLVKGLGAVYDGKKNKAVKALEPDFASNPEASKKRLQDTQEHFLKMLMTQLKLQDPTDPTDASEITQITSQLTLVQQSIEQNKTLHQIAEALKNSGLDKAQNYIGQEVHYDVGEKEFYGVPIEYEYNVEYDGEFSDPKEYQLRSKIIILNEKNEKIFEFDRTSNVLKNNRYLWNGKRIDPKTKKEEFVPQGKYRIQVDAEIIDLKLSQSQGLKVETTTLKSGIVSEIRNKDGRPKLFVNGDLIDPDDVIRLTGADKGKNSESNFNNGLSYLGKNASLEVNSLKVKNDYADIEFQNNIADHGNAMIKIKDPKTGDHVATAFIDKKEVKQGKNYYSWHALKALRIDEINDYKKYKNSKDKELRDKYNLTTLPKGDYLYEVYVEDLNSTNETDKYVRQINKVEGIVTKVNKLDNNVTIDGVEYPLDRITEVEDTSSVSTKGNNHSAGNIYNAANIHGKTIEFSNDHFDYDQNELINFKFKLDTPLNNSQYFGAEMRIIDQNDRVVDILKKNIDEIKYNGQQTPPLYLELNEQSKSYINGVISNNHYDTESNYYALNNDQRKLVSNKIKELAYGKNYEELTPFELADKEEYRALDKDQKQLVDKKIKEIFYKKTFDKLSEKELATKVEYESLTLEQKQLIDIRVKEVVYNKKFDELSPIELADKKGYSDLTTRQKNEIANFMKEHNLLPPFYYRNLNGLNAVEANKLICEEFGSQSYINIHNLETQKETHLAKSNYKGFYEGLDKNFKAKVNDLVASKYINDPEYSKLSIEKRKETFNKLSTEEKAAKFNDIGLQNKNKILQHLRENHDFHLSKELQQTNKFIEENYNDVFNRISEDQKTLVTNFIRNFGNSFVKESFQETLNSLPEDKMLKARDYVTKDLNFKVTYDHLNESEQKIINRFINKNFATGPHYNNLTSEQRTIADDILKKYYTKYDLYTNLSPHHKDIIDREIENKYYNGKIHSEEFDLLTKEQKSHDLEQRIGENTFSWNGIRNKLNNDKFPKGVYKYEVFVMAGKDLAHAEAKKINVNAPGNGKVSEVRIDKGENIYIVQTKDGPKEVREKQIISIKEPSQDIDPDADAALPQAIKNEVASLVNETLTQVEKQSTEMMIKRQQDYLNAQQAQLAAQNVQTDAASDASEEEAFYY